MTPALWRTLGFALPTLVLITALHLFEVASFGEALDGVLSSLWFVAVFLTGALVRQRLARGVGVREGRQNAALQLLLGMAAGILAWCLLWLLWEVTPALTAQHLAGYAFAINSTTVFLVALNLPELGALRWRSA